MILRNARCNNEVVYMHVLLIYLNKVTKINIDRFSAFFGIRMNAEDT